MLDDSCSLRQYLIFLIEKLLKNIICFVFVFCFDLVIKYIIFQFFFFVVFKNIDVTTYMLWFINFFFLIILIEVYKTKKNSTKVDVLLLLYFNISISKPIIILFLFYFIFFDMMMEFDYWMNEWTNEWTNTIFPLFSLSFKLLLS